MMDATVFLKPVVFGLKAKVPDMDPEVKRLVEEWRLARRAGDRERARTLAGMVGEAREAHRKANARR